MKTDDLVAMLSASVEPVGRRLVVRTICIAVVAASVFALGIILIGPGIRPDLTTARAFTFLLLKLVFTVVIVGVALIYLTRLARPMRRAKNPFDYGCNAVHRDCVACRNQPRIRAALALGCNDCRGSMA